MAKQTINIGTSANDGTGSTLREAFDICNDNFTELYDGTGGLLYKLEGTNFTDSLLIGHSTTGTLDNALGNTGIGVAALDALTSGDYNVAVGNEAGSAITSGERNVLMGYAAGDAITISSYNTAVGHGALSGEDTRHGSTAFGYKALNKQNADADPYNTAVGYHAAFLLTTGVYNTILGGLAGDALTTGNSNIAIGLNALGGEDTGHDSVAIGRSALLSQNYDGSAYNVAIGRDAGRLVDTGIKNTIIGGLAGDNLTTGSNNILIGYDATASAVGVSNEVTIGDSNISTVRIPSDSTLKIGASGDLQLEHVSSNSFIKNTAVGDLYIENQVDDKDVIFRSDDGSGGLATYFFLDGSSSKTVFPDNKQIQMGSGGGDGYIYSDGTNMWIQGNNPSADIKLYQGGTDGSIRFYSDNGSGGQTEYFAVDGGEEQVRFFKETEHQDSVKAKFGDSGDLQIQHTGATGIIDNQTGDLIVKVSQDNGDIIFQSDNGSGGIDTYFRLDGGDERTEFEKEALFNDNVKLQVGSSADMEIYHDGSHSYVKQGGTGDLYIQQFRDDGDIVFQSDDGSGGMATYFRVDGGDERVNFSKNVGFSDNVKAMFGDGLDLRIYHNSSNDRGYIYNATGDLYIENDATDGDIKFYSDDGSGGTAQYFRVDGGVVETRFLKSTLHFDNVLAKFGDSGDLQIVHNGTDTQINNTTGNLQFTQLANDKDISFASDNGSGGDTIYFYLDGSHGITRVSRNFRADDNVALQVGADGDAGMYHDGTNTYIQNDTGDLYIRNNYQDRDIILQSDDGGGGVATYIQVDGSTGKVELNHYGTKKLETTSAGVEVAGSVKADGNIALGNIGGVARLQHEGSGQLKMLSSGDSTIATFTSTGSTFPSDIETTSSSKGLILKSPNGTRFRITVDNSGNLSTTSL